MLFIYFSVLLLLIALKACGKNSFLGKLYERWIGFVTFMASFFKHLLWPGLIHTLLIQIPTFLFDLLRIGLRLFNMGGPQKGLLWMVAGLWAFFVYYMGET